MDILLVELTSVLITPGPTRGLWMMVLYCDDVHPLLYSHAFYFDVALLADVLYMFILTVWLRVRVRTGGGPVRRRKISFEKVALMLVP